MEGYSNDYFKREYCNSDLINSLRKALKVLLNCKCLDLTIKPHKGHLGLRFYTEFNRLDSVGKTVPELKKDDFIALNANITVPAGYEAAFDDTNRRTIISLCDLRAVAAVVEEDEACKLLKELKRKYDHVEVYETNSSCNKDILDALLNCKCDVFNIDPVYEIFVRAIGRSFKPIKGEIVAYDSQLLWVRATDCDVPSTFYIVPLDYISFISRC